MTDGNNLSGEITRCEDRMKIIQHTLNNQGNFNLNAEQILELREEYAELEAEIAGIKLIMNMDKGSDVDTGGDECVVCQG